MRIVVALLAALLVLVTLPAGAKVYIDIAQPGSQRVPVAVPEFRLLGPAPPIGTELADLLSADLTYTGFFQVLPRSAYLEPASTESLTSDAIDFRRWNLIGSHLLVTGGMSTKEGQLRLELRLFDVLEGKMLVGKAYVGSREQARQMVRRFAGEIVRCITGLEPIFDTRLAFVSDARGHKEVYVMDFDGYNVTPLTNMGAITLSPAWSPGGTQVSFVSYRSGKPNLYSIATQSKSFHRIHGGSLCMSPAWSPDGKTVAAALSFEGNTDLCLLDPQGKLLKRLTNDGAIDIEPTWSPDGKRLAFVSSRGGTPQVYVMEVASGEVKRLTFSGSYNTSPVWSPRGDRIAFAGRIDGSFEVFTMTPDGGDVQQLTSGAGSNESPSWSPDGMMLTFSSTRLGGSRIFVMNADGRNQRPIGPAKGHQSEPAWSGRLGTL